jgi:hypothetical protein
MFSPHTPWYCWIESRINNRYQGGQSAAMVIREARLACASHQFKKNGHVHNGKQNHPCKDCGRQLVLQAENRLIAEDQRTLVERLFPEKISLHGICRGREYQVGHELSSCCFDAMMGALFRAVGCRPCSLEWPARGVKGGWFSSSSGRSPRGRRRALPGALAWREGEGA